MSVTRSILLIIISMALGVFSPKASDFDYSKGILIVNEDWYGHQNSSINYLEPDNDQAEYWRYRIIREENPGRELGCTNQYASIWNGRLYCIAKQDKDPGASTTGGRITVCNAQTLQILHQQSLIDPSGAQCDGRAFVGINEHKGYISSSNGIWIYDLDNFEIKGMVEGSGNPFAGGNNDKPNTDPTGALYYGQTGIMIYTEGLVFAAHQQYGLLIIDPNTDSVIEVMSLDIVESGAGIGSLVKSKDGSLWISVAKNTQGLGSALNYIVKLDPVALEYEVKKLPDDINGPLNSWYAWTPDAFIASPNENILYWKGGVNTWFSGVWIFRYDIDKNEFSLFIDLKDDPNSWKLYGCSMGIDPKTNDIYLSLYQQFGKPVYTVRRYSSSGEILKEYPMIENYWFPSVMIFPQNEQDAKISSISDDYGKIEVVGKTLKCINYKGKRLDLYSLNGQYIRTIKPVSDEDEYFLDVCSGIYVIRGPEFSKKILIK